ncbi:GNAT family N-acetyltransferase [Nonomuraea sp. WAC 01424]|uniref:GNAT family N-acetyltransferase n=1 Tax=Nonomuraea sp. WAC 01424 TaxID=2203200 RepID=UPI000F775C1D|nr:GNAT family N-acetyltransferase [Nonomuraea sp. WAC 01424]RSN06566.1 GNAT family N-acetyltransferase [Nonomuraea sp. WAC 01424]
MADELGRAIAFQHAFARRKSPAVLPVPGGFAVLDERYPMSHDDNRLIVESGRPGAALAAAEETLAALGHRLVCVDDDRLGQEFRPAFAAAGYEHDTNLVMAFHGVRPAASAPAERLGLEELLPVLRAEWRESLPHASEQVVEGLAARAATRTAGADRVEFRAVRAPGGQVAARADLYVHDGVAQIENVYTGERHRGQGHARALMTALLAETADAELTFLVADAADWPREFYARLGFVPLGRTHAFLRT